MSCITNGSGANRKPSHTSSVTIARKETFSSAAKRYPFVGMGMGKLILNVIIQPFFLKEYEIELCGIQVSMSFEFFISESGDFQSTHSVYIHRTYQVV